MTVPSETAQGRETETGARLFPAGPGKESKKL